MLLAAGLILSSPSSLAQEPPECAETPATCSGCLNAKRCANCAPAEKPWTTILGCSFQVLPTSAISAASFA